MWRLCSDLVPVVRFVVQPAAHTDLPKPSVIRLKGARRTVAKARWVRSMGLFIVASIASRPAVAQTVNPDLTPVDLFVPEHGDGVRITPGFILYPAVETTIDFDSNIYNVESSKRSDAIGHIRPSLVLDSDFTRHSIELDAGADIKRYANNSAENAEAYYVDLKSRLDLAGLVTVRPEAGAARGYEQRGTAGDQFLTDKPVTYHRRYVGVEVARDRGILGLTARGRITTLSYDDASVGGLPIDLSDRDVTLRSVSLRARYRLHEGYSTFIEGGLSQVDYRTTVGAQRNSHGYSILAGVQFQPSAMIDIEAGAGYLQQDFDDPAFTPVKALNYRLSANWIPRRDWAVRAEVRRDVDPSPRFDTAAIFRTQYIAGVQHSMGDRMLVGAEAAAVTEDYRGIVRSDQYYRVGVSARYRLNDRVGLTAQAGYRSQDGGRNYGGFSAGIGVRIAV
ncbi:outer membrane beta-barrel protein [Tsuneonella mangrovi]|uniref:outer membrane beta-barrel protein n=1 Tax=Tsuneonella mangrovi TaxID=1982042 RepID=UPI0014711D26|nr:outer membrane beta-barrel protein [Tsuneonella mangrovi]